jgi:hypothetical protein
MKISNIYENNILLNIENKTAIKALNMEVVINKVIIIVIYYMYHYLILLKKLHKKSKNIVTAVRDMYE